MGVVRNRFAAAHRLALPNTRPRAEILKAIRPAHVHTTDYELAVRMGSGELFWLGNETRLKDHIGKVRAVVPWKGGGERKRRRKRGGGIQRWPVAAIGA